jgi:uncharacterized membrane protein YgcG
MRRLYIYYCLVFGAVLMSSVPHAMYAAERIPSFEAHIAVQTNATIEVEERVVYDFDTTPQHGIFRAIPFSYQAGRQTYTADISSVLVTNDAGEPLPFTESRGNGELTIKIGDPEKTVVGQQVYRISYVVRGPFLYFDDYDELYWNITGSWPKNSIATSSVLIDLPVGASVLRASCYQGAPGSKTSCTYDERLVSDERAGYTARAEELALGEGFTVAIDFPKGVIVKVSQPWDNTTSPWQYAPFGVPLLALLGMLRIWYVKGRDPAGMGTIVTQFEPPPHLSPSLAYLVSTETITTRTVSAEIIRLAVEGYLRIHRIEDHILGILPTTDYLLERLPTNTTPTDAVGSLLLEQIYTPAFAGTAMINGVEVQGTLLSKMRHAFATEYAELQQELYEEVIDRGYFPSSPRTVRMRWVGLGILVIIVGVVLLPQFIGVASIIAGCIVGSVGWYMPVRTRTGVLVREHLEGFKRYLTVAEKDRLAFHNAPERTPALFDHWLPYAIAFGVEEQWGEQFKDIYTTPPTWYQGGSIQDFAAASFVSDLTSFTDTAASASAPQSSGTSGGGSVGGGFGGGGGGSW